MPKLIRIESTDKLLLPGLLYEPGKKTKKAAFYLHGTGGGSVFYAVPRMNQLAEDLNSKGITFLAFNNRGGELIRGLNKTDGTRPIYGSAMETIKDCIKDINGAIAYLESQGYKTFYLIGHSTGANKAAVYNYYKPRNKIAKFVLTGPGDDTGWYYKAFGPKTFSELLDESKQQTKVGNGTKFSSQALKIGEYMSFQSLYDIMNPDGDYNTYPYYEYKNHLDVSSKELFREFGSIKKPVLVIYGSEDEYCEGATEAIEILKDKSGNKDKFEAKIIEGAEHKFTGYEKQMAETIADWLARRD